MRPFERHFKELRIPWTTHVDNGVDRFSDSERTLSDRKAGPQKKVSADSLVDHERTLLSKKLPRRPSEGIDYIPDDRKKKTLL